MTFSEAYAIHGPDVEAIADALGIAPSAADSMINAELTQRHIDRIKEEKRRTAQRDHMRRVRSDLRSIRAGRSA
jgi:hypothetical protein